MNETFTLNYLSVQTLNKENITNKEKENLAEKVVENMLNSLLNLDEVSLDEILNLVGQKYTKVKYKNKASLTEIEKIYKDAINKYTEKIDNLKVENHNE